MDPFKAVTGAFMSLFTAIFLEYFLKFRPGLSEKYVLKSDCQRNSDQLHRENREDHQEIFRKLDELQQSVSKTQTMISTTKEKVG